MPKQMMDTLTESMYYVLMAFQVKDCCGTDIVAFIQDKTKGQVSIGPGTLYTILSKFEEEAMIKEIAVEGRKRTYCITDKGSLVYQDELNRLRRCVQDGEGILTHEN